MSFHSNPSSPNKLYLAFDGFTGPQNGFPGAPVVSTPPCEVVDRQPIFDVVSRVLAPLNIDATDEAPPTGTKQPIIAVGGSYQDWLGGQPCSGDANQAERRSTDCECPPSLARLRRMWPVRGPVELHDPLLRSMFHAGGQPGRAQVGGHSGCP